MLTAYLRALVRDEALVDDLFQETMLTAWRRIEDFDRSRPFGPWLRGIARRLAIGEYRRQSRRFFRCSEGVMDALDQLAERVESRPGDVWAEKLEFLERCLNDLPPEYRTVVTLRYHQQQKPAQIADTLQEQLATIKKRLQRARLRLATCMQRKLGIGSQVTASDQGRTP